MHSPEHTYYILNKVSWLVTHSQSLLATDDVSSVLNKQFHLMSPPLIPADLCHIHRHHLLPFVFIFYVKVICSAQISFRTVKSRQATYNTQCFGSSVPWVCPWCLNYSSLLRVKLVSINLLYESFTTCTNKKKSHQIKSNQIKFNVIL